MKIPLLSKVNAKDLRIIGIEGLNGVGKTTLIGNACSVDHSIKRQLCVPENYTSNLEFKSFMLSRATPIASALYYLSGIAESLKELRVSGGSTVLLDRSIWSTFAALYAKDKALIPSLFEAVHALTPHLVVPDVTIVLLADFETCRMRISTKTKGKEFDNDTHAEFQEKERFYYLLKDAGYDIRFVNTMNKSPDEVCNEFFALI